MKKFEVKVDDRVINNIIKNVKEYEWKNIIDENSWSLGVNKKELKKLCDYWINEYNWKKQEDKINTFDHFKTQIEDLNIHFIYKKGKIKILYHYY